MKLRLTASLVLYKSDPQVFEEAIKSFLEGTLESVLVVADNSPEPIVSRFFSHPRVKYVHSGKNVGFGAGHNLAFSHVSEASDLHLILNPDIVFSKDVLPYLTVVMMDNPCIGALMPRIRYPDGKIQHLCKLLPNPVDLIFRRFVPVAGVREMINRRYELRDLPQKTAIDVPSLSGCFLVVRSDVFKQIQGFDERYFMYLEDVDLVRRIGDVSRTVFDPAFSVTHAYGKGSYRSFKLLSYHTRSALSYFFKWGWIYDPVRRSRNAEVLSNMHVPADETVDDISTSLAG